LALAQPVNPNNDYPWAPDQCRSETYLLNAAYPGLPTAAGKFDFYRDTQDTMLSAFHLRLRTFLTMVLL